MHLHVHERLIAEATIQKQRVKKGICQDTTPVLGSFAVCRKKNDLIIA